MSVIEFHGVEMAIQQQFPRPFPAARAVPEWVKKLPMDLNDDPRTPTVKRCPPFLEALTSGYLIPVPVDCHFTRDAAGKLTIEAKVDVVGRHHEMQVGNAPFAGAPLVKFRNPWLIRTPAGYSTLFVQPLNRFEIPFVPLAGVVETDTYYRMIHFPAVCTLPPNASYTLKAGTPIVQAIPIGREGWESQFIPADEQRMREADQAFRENPHLYKEQFWLKHEYD